MRSTTNILSLIVAFVAIVGCNNRTTEPTPIQFDPPDRDERDAGPDLTTMPMPDGICDGIADGYGCSLDNATGVCVGERCRQVACLTGFDNCDEEPGCETDIRLETTCGGCDTSCAPEQGCQLGPDGFICNAGITCPDDRFDLDSDPANGCEWQAEWEASWPLVPADLQIDTVTWAGSPVVGGLRDDERITVRLGTTPSPVVWNVPAAPSPPVGIGAGTDWTRVVWADGVSAVNRDESARGFLQPECESVVSRRFVGFSGDLAATTDEIWRFGVGDECLGTVCLDPVFSWSDYLDSALPQSPTALPLEGDELANCATCITGPDAGVPDEPRCLGPRQCRTAEFDQTECDCSGTGCPTLEIVDVVSTEEVEFVITARGFIALGPEDYGVLARAETPFVPNTAGGPRYVGAIPAGDRELVLLHSTGFIAGASVDPATGAVDSTFPAIGTGVDLENGSVATGDGAVVIVANDTARLLQPTANSGRSVFLTLDTAPGVQGLRPIATLAEGDAIRVFYLAAGQLFSRRLSRVTDASGSP